MSLRKNVTANYISQFYVSCINILILPLYIKYMGSEAYGLVGFFAMLQAWFALLDLGLTPTIARETARYHGGSMTALAFRQLFRALSIFFAFTALIGVSGLLFFAEFITNKWLNFESLSAEVVLFSVQIISITVALRWLCGLFRGVITGSEKFVWLSGFSVLVATLRSLAVFASMYMFGYTPKVFFLHQLCVALLDFIGLWLKTRTLIPTQALLSSAIGWSFQPIKSVLRFSLTIAFTSATWVFVTQSDKLILSGILPLEEYGYFTLAVLVANGVMMLSGPISSAVMPKMTKLYAEDKKDEMFLLYRDTTRFVTIIMCSAVIVIVFCAESFLMLWTNDKVLSTNAAPILQLYAIGNGFLAISAFPYYLQYALGNLRYHFIGNVFTVFTLIPFIVLAAINFGAIGAGFVWLFVNAVFLFLWCGFIHSKLAPKIMITWLVNDILRIIWLPLLSAFLIRFFQNYFTSDSAFNNVLVFVSMFAISLLLNLKINPLNKNERSHNE